MKAVGRLHRLATLDISDARYDSANLNSLSTLRSLKVLFIKQSEPIINGLNFLKHLESLREITLSVPGITDDDLLNIEGLSDLEFLVIDYLNPITDAGLRHVAKLPHLNHLYIASQEFTDDGIIAFPEFDDLQVLILLRAYPRTFAVLKVMMANWSCKKPR
jgi:hypothetical protein